ncbi:Retrovirus-related Pol polyprotein from transposon TNT 1-94 [Vitis vinifera]|uniref:Retrovirus-related Pol polyprotein from transposon TNT 1-94 n=1 Tax=Vitis vinifera TaxID=29760 RepID=A0A438FK93_VITVI|nr:Retrovirus-related Pol polyprotein from transposon TNT 1-94 [Vitis vinifera]
MSSLKIPNQSSSVEGILNLEPDPFMKRLPLRHNRAIPNSVQEALADPRWKAAMNEETKSLQKNETWEFVECPLGKKPVGCCWIYTVKYKFDVKNVFLHGELFEEVYMDLPPGCMVSEKQCQKVCKLKKSLYGLKQSPRAWFERSFTKRLECRDVNLLIQPIEEGLKLCVEPNQVSIDKGRYQRLVGRLMYLAHTRPDLAYALSVVSQYMHNPGEQHMNVGMRILSAVDDRRSTSSYFTFVGGNLVTWKSYLSRQPIRLFCDNKVACDIAHNPIQHDRTKHVEVDRFFIKEKLDDKIVELPKIRSKINWLISSPKLSQVKCSQNF